MRIPFLNHLSLASRFNLASIALILLASGGIGLFMSRNEIEDKYAALISNGRTIAEMTAENCEIGIYTEDRASLHRVVESLSVNPDIAYVSVMNRNHDALVSKSFRAPAGIPDCPFHESEPVTATIYRDFTSPGDHQGSHGYIEILAPVKSGGTADIWDIPANDSPLRPAPRVIGYLRLGLSRDSIQKRVRELLVTTAVFAALLITAGSALTILLTRRISAPLRKLQAAAHDVADGNFDAPLPEGGGGEIADLAGSFNHMLGRLRVYRAEVEDRTAELTATNERLLNEIAERRQAEEALKESEERYALAAQGANDGLWDWNLMSNTVYYSERWWGMIGCPDRGTGTGPDEWLGRVHADDTERVRREIGGHLGGSTPLFESEYRMRHRDGSYRWMLCRGIAVRKEDGTAYRMAGSQTDITARKQAEAQLLHDAFHDALTGLPNRVLFLDRLAHAIAIARRRKDYIFAVLFLDLDRFKVVNDSLGHLVGDQLLVELGRRIGGSLRPGDTIARLGGDEFGVLLEDIRSLSNATYIAERIQRALAAPFTVEGHEVFANASIGIALNAAGYERPEQLLRDADTAMYQAKTHTRGGYVIFEPGMHEHAVERLRLETELRRAVERREFAVYYQPVLSLTTNRVAGYEALVRWNHPLRGIVGPGEFIPMAEETGIAIAIDRLVLREACRQMQEWLRAVPDSGLEFMSVNLSSRQLSQPDLVELVSKVLWETGLGPEKLKLEITENVIIDNPGAAAEMLGKLRSLGVQLYIDDFGTGYSALSYLHDLPINGLKIDRSFIQRMGKHGEKQQIVKTILALGKDLNIDVIAEGIETEDQLAQLKSLQCRYGQGYIFSKPVDSEKARALIEKSFTAPGEPA
jgi:diguanylate cyclase (GGDEF)-like protein/PAS domain S-box-containing protein